VEEVWGCEMQPKYRSLCLVQSTFQHSSNENECTLGIRPGETWALHGQENVNGSNQIPRDT
jgi:hypothetical protein